MDQARSRRPLIKEPRVRSQGSPCGICVGESCTLAGLSTRTAVFPQPSVISPVTYQRRCTEVATDGVTKIAHLQIYDAI